MSRKFGRLISLTLGLLLFVSCATVSDSEQDIITNQFPDAQAELMEVVRSLAEDAMRGNIEGLKAVHLESEKFSKFGPRSFERQDVASTNESEAAFFGSVTNMRYEPRELKIDAFGDIGVVTYYPHVSFVQDGEEKKVDGRQTLVFVRTNSGWKIVHEHGTIRK